MLAKTRQDEMREIILRNGRATITELAETFHVTTETVRRDLTVLSSCAPIRRVHGGAVLLPPILEDRDYEIRRITAPEEKRQIGILAAGSLSSGDIVYIDEGSVTEAFAEAIVGLQNLKIVTCSIQIAAAIQRKLKRGEISGTLIQLGGVVEPMSGAVHSGDCFDQISRMNYTSAFFGATAVSQEGALFWSTAMAQFTRCALARAEKRICLAESDKFGKTSFCLCAGFDMIDRIITDDTHPIPDPIIRTLRQNGTDLSIAALAKNNR